MASSSTAEASNSVDEPPPHPIALSSSSSPSIARLPSALSLSEMQRPRKLKLLIAANGPKDVAWAQTIAVRLSKDTKIEVRAIVDDLTHRLAQEIICYQNRPCNMGDRGSKEDDLHYRAFELVEWADLLVLAPIDANNLAKMMSGIADTLLLELLRSWDASKRILLVPGMSTHMWESPITKKQMSKLHKKWQWIRILQPILWSYEGAEHHGTPKRVVRWGALNEVIGIIKNQSELLCLGHDVDAATQGLVVKNGKRTSAKLPTELWSIIFEHTNDWELAQACGIYTNLPIPTHLGWRLEPRNPNDPLSVYQHELEWTILSASSDAICKKLSDAPASFRELSALAIKLIFKFTLTGVLSYIEANCPHMFKCFDGKTIPTKASAYYGRIEILDWWARSPSFLQKQYDNEALDVASKNGYVHVLEWWRRSGLPLKYTAAALEQASARGHMHVLEWWREAYLQNPAEVDLKPGKSILAAAQYGRIDAIRWWEGSGVTFGHDEQVCKVASRYGQVGVLELWRGLKGDDKLSFDCAILTEPTLYSHIGVLDWWLKYAHGELPGMDGRRAKKVEYRMMDIEEALEDALGDQTEVRRWWAAHGLNLGVGTTAWMKATEL
ncbi:hypothetical protein SLS53_001630 [Cytospora paraplurivora]|uniref:Flavoprotein domain-containing protein n=1 Tax=Cytospora paraplurivora TaxID=2898453 RepID=A0AAN9UI30_9PEZI